VKLRKTVAVVLTSAFYIAVTSKLVIYATFQVAYAFQALVVFVVLLSVVIAFVFQAPFSSFQVHAVFVFPFASQQVYVIGYLFA